MATTKDQLEADNKIDDSLTSMVQLGEKQTPEEQEHWIKEIERARKHRKDFDTAGQKTIERYAAEKSKEGNSDYNLFFANTDIKMAALYSRTPQPDIRRRNMDAKDDAGRVASTLLQRTASMELDVEDFDSTFKQVLFDWKVPGIGIAWVRLEETYETVPQQTQGVDEFGNPTIVEEEVEQLVEQNSPIDYVAWKDFLWAPCKVWTDCRWVARIVPMSKEAVASRFGDTCEEDVLKELSYEAKPDPKDKNDKCETQNTTDIIEIWDKETRTIYWISEGAPYPLDVREDDKEFPGFFPTPLPPLGRFTTSSTIPRSDYVLSQGLYNAIDRLQAKAADLIECIKARGGYDASIPELRNILSSEANTMIAIKDLAIINSEKGGVANAMAFVPIDQYSTVLAQTISQINLYKQQLYEIEGIADFMRGETQAYDSAAAIKQKGQFAPNRLGMEQKAVAKYVERLIQLKTHLISKFYKPEILVDHAGALPEADMQYLGQAVQLLQSNFKANFALSVSVDSIQDTYWRVEQEERANTVRTVSGMLQQAGPAMQQRPEIAPLVIELIRYAVAGTKGSDAIEGILDASLDQVQQALKAGAGQQQQPSKEQIKAQIAEQKNQTDLQIAQQKNQTDIVIAQSEAQSRAVNDAQELEVARMNTQVAAVEAQAKLIGAIHKQAHDLSRPR